MRRRVCAWLAAVLFAAQALVAAHACAVAAPADALRSVAVPAAECHTAASPLPTPTNATLCKAHCTGDSQVPSDAAIADAPPAMPLWFVVPTSDLPPLEAQPPASLAAARSGAPPGWPPLYLTQLVLRN
jgi:hypothetical protein